MRKIIFIILVLLAFSLFGYYPTYSPAKDLNPTNTPAQIYFSPHGGCTKAIVEELNKAKREILVQAYRPLI